MKSLFNKMMVVVLMVIVAVMASWGFADTPVAIADSGLYSALFDELGEVPTEENMATLNSLYVGADSYTISDLTGLEYAVNLEDLVLYGQDISDYSAISSLSQLQYLYLADNLNLYDLSFLEGLNLSFLDISNCNVSDLSPLGGMYNLSSLYASGNYLDDLSGLSGLSLDDLDISYCNVSDLSWLTGLYYLYSLTAMGNNISDLSPLALLTNLQYVYLEDNNISDFSPLADISNYYFSAYLSSNNISDISPAVNFSSSDSLYLDDNLIEDLSALRDDTDLPYISLYGCPINAASYCHILPEIIANNYLGVIDLPENYTCSDPAIIPDAALKSAIEAELGIVNPTISDMAGLLHLTAGGLGISDVAGLELASNLLDLDLSDNSIIDITPIQYLRRLESLNISLNNLDQNSFCGVLVMLEANNPALIDGSTLFTDANPFECPTIGHFIPDINLRILVQNELGLSEEPNQTDMLDLYELLDPYPSGPEWSKVVDLTGLEYAINLYMLDLSGHNVSGVSPLASLTSLVALYLSDNNISNITPLSNLTNLEALYLASNSGITNISAVSTLSSLRFFGCSWCGITDVSPVSGLIQLEELQIDSNPIADITPIYGLTNLTRLGLGGLGLTDLSILSIWPDMTYLSLSSSPGLDLSSLNQYTSLTTLFLFSSSISDLSFLSTMVNLEGLGLGYNSIQDISPIANLTALERLYLYNNQIRDISPLTGLTTMQYCYIEDNPLNTHAYCTDVPLIQANNAGMVDFSYGVNTNPLSSDCTADTADLGVVGNNWIRTDCDGDNNWCGGADFNMDGTVNFFDFAELAEIWLAIP